MGQKKTEQLAQPGGDAVASAWAQRKAEQAARTETAMADPVSRFYLLHGHPARRQPPESVCRTADLLTWQTGTHVPV